MIQFISLAHRASHRIKIPTIHGVVFTLLSKVISPYRGFIKFLCRRSVGVFSRAFLVFLMKESKKRR